MREGGRTAIVDVLPESLETSGADYWAGVLSGDRQRPDRVDTKRENSPRSLQEIRTKL